MTKKEVETVPVELVLNNAKAYAKNRLRECSLAIHNGHIVKIGTEASMPTADKKIDLKNLLALPGLIDAHVHLRDQRKAYKENFYSGTASAAAGGFTTVLDMPNNDPVTMSKRTLSDRVEIAKSKIVVDVGFFCEFPHRLTEIGGIAKAGAVGFKLFMAEQVGGMDIGDDKPILKAFRETAQHSMPVAVHAEDETMLHAAKRRLQSLGRDDVSAFLDAHSEAVEVTAVKRLLTLASASGARLHFCHASTQGALRQIADAKKTGMPVTCEVTPHHLLLSSEDLKELGTLALTMPPVRKKSHTSALWRGIRDNVVDVVGSDHAPHTIAEKEAENVWNVKVGIPGLETTIPLLLTEVNNGKLSLADAVCLLSERPAEIFGLKSKGKLEEGYCADLTVIDLKQTHKIDASKFHSKAKFSPFDGWRVQGKVVKTFVGGNLVFDEDHIIAEAGTGRVIRRGVS